MNKFSCRDDKMSKLILLFVFAAFLQFGICLPSTLKQNSSKDRGTVEYNDIEQDVNSTKTHSATQLPDESVISRGRNRLSAMIGEGSTKHVTFLLQGTNRIAKELLADSSIINMDTESIKKEKSVLEQYIKDSDEALQPSFTKCKERILKKFFTFSNRYAVKKGNRTNEENIVWQALQAHGFEQFEAEENKLLNDIGKHYADEFENYLKSLAPADREKEKDLVYVYETYMENKHIMDRANYGFRFKDFFSKS